MNKEAELLVDKINTHWQKHSQGENRPHLGGSQIGQNCLRKLWYTFRWATKPDFEGRILRLFQRGHDEEKNFCRDLRYVGGVVSEVDPQTKKQYTIHAHGGHFSGSLDGIGQNLPHDPTTPHLLEFKTSGEKAFKYLKENKVEKAKPEHFVQMNIYMGFYGLKRACYMVVNKNNDEYYVEIVDYNAKVFEKYLDRAKAIIESNIPCVRAGDNSSHYTCRFCDFNKICHDEIERRAKCPEANCRTCINSTPIDTNLPEKEVGEWHCKKYELIVSDKDQRQGGACPSHLFIPPMLSFAEFVEVDGDSIKYKLNGFNGLEPVYFWNCPADKKGKQHFLSSELAALDVALLGDAGFLALRENFNGTVVSEKFEASEDEIPF